MNPAENSSALRSLKIFETFRDARSPLSLSNLAALSGEPISTSHGVVHALQRSGYLYSPAGREMYPTRRLLDMALEIDEHDPVASIATPALSALRDALGETVLLGARQRDETMFLLVLAGSQSIRYAARVGETRALHASSIGKAILGQLEPDALEQWLDKQALAQVTSRTLTSATALRKELDACRRRCYYRTQGESVLDVMGIAMPVRIGGTTYGVSVAGPIQRMRGAEKRIAAMLAECVAGLQRAASGG